MPTNGSSTRRITRSKGPLLAGVLATVAALLVAGAGPAAAAVPGPDTELKPGQAWMGAGVRAEQDPTASADGGVSVQDTSGVQGIDVSHWQGSINWTSVKNAGIDFAYI